MLEANSDKMPASFFFTEIKVTGKQRVFAMVDFAEHAFGNKCEFNVGSINLLIADDNKLLQGTMKSSFETFNTAIEWSRTYFEKVRFCFCKRVREASFKLIEPSDCDDEEYRLTLNFQLGQTSVLAFKCTLRPAHGMQQ